MRAFLACLLLFGCSTPTTETPTQSAEVVSGASASAIPSAIASGTASVEVPKLEPFGDLDIDPASFDFKGNPELVGRIAESPHAYFRFTQRLFARAICKRFDAKVATAPKVRLHGDPHVEQFAVTDLGRGLADFDDASVGPAFVDLTRFATSILIAERMQGLTADEETAAVGELFRGYRAGLNGGELPKEPPKFASQLIGRFKKDRTEFLAFVGKSLLPIDAKEEELVKSEVGAYVSTLKGKDARPASFFAIKKVGRTKLGIGSALTRKYLLIVEGESKAENDDVVIELKEVADLSAVPCIQGIPSGAADAKRDEQKGPLGKKLLVPALLPDKKFWVNEWLSNYEEAKIKRLGAEDLRALSFEAGLVLAREHKKPLPDAPAPGGDAPKIDEALERDIRAAAIDLAAATTKGWTRFKKEVQGS